MPEKIQLKYAGPRTMISHSGVGFDRCKQDKYLYIPFTLHLLKAIDHEYAGESCHVYAPEGVWWNDTQMHEIIVHYCTDADARARKRLERKNGEIDRDIATAETHPFFSADARDAWVKNLRLMRTYTLQRTVNKSLYYSAVDALTTLLVHKRVYYLQAPFSVEHFHVFHSIEGAVRRLRFSLSTAISVYEKSGELLVRLELASR